jgi:hypothetical protein
MTGWNSILRGALARFVPGVLAVFGVSFVLAAALKGSEIGPNQVVGFLSLGLAMTLGYVVTLGLLRPSLDAGARVEGRRSLLAGLGSTCLLLGLGMLHSGPTSQAVMNGFALLAGGLTTAGIFFPWLASATQREDAFERELAAVGEPTFPEADASGIESPSRNARDRVIQ